MVKVVAQRESFGSGSSNSRSCGSVEAENFRESSSKICTRNNSLHSRDLVRVVF